MSGANAEFIAELYGRYLENPDAVDESWREFFAEFRFETGSGRGLLAGKHPADRGYEPVCFGTGYLPHPPAAS